MSRRVAIALLAGAALGTAIFLAGISPAHHPTGRQASAVTLFAPTHLRPVGRGASRAGSTSHATPAQRTSDADPGALARAFLAGWLACNYHHAPCSTIPGELHAYASALAQQNSRSAATPAERRAHPQITSIQLSRSCANAVVATATYQDGNGGTFELHVNLVRETAGWRVFDVAEAPPHIPLPRPLSRGPRGC
jgi:hypothetical protein